MLPLPLLLLLIALGLAMIWFSRFQKSGKSLLPWAGWRCCYSACNRSLTVYYVRLKTPTRRGREIRRWAISWCWAAGIPGSELGAQLEPDQQQPAAPERGIRLWLANPGSKMIFTGAAAKTNPVSTAEAGARVAESLGVPRSAIITLDSPKDTEEEAAAVKQAIGDVPFLLVTSASHLPRAMIFFEKQGLHPLPAPANQLAIDARSIRGNG